MSTVLLTGGTGLVGSNVAALLREKGHRLRALVRAGSDTSYLESLGAEIVPGDVGDAESVLSAAKGCDGIIHSAAALGGPEQTDESMRINVIGARSVLDAGAATNARVVLVSSVVVLDHTPPITEDSPLASEPTDHYSISKLAALREGEARVDAGQDVVFVLPGSIYGPGQPISRALGKTSFNRAIRAAINGRVTEYLNKPSPWVLSEDVAAVVVAAWERGRTGARYLAFGAEDSIGGADWLNAACAAAGVPHRVRPRVPDPKDPELLRLYGPSVLARLTEQSLPSGGRRVDASRTQRELGTPPTPLPEAMTRTVAWLRRHGQIPS